MIIWIDGAFGSGKTTLTGELRRRLPAALEFDPEYVGMTLARSVPKPGPDDFQDIPLWRRLTATFLLALRTEYDRTTLVPMTLWNPAHREEIFGLVSAGGERIFHVFLDVTADELRRRIEAQILMPHNPAADADARAFRLAHIDRGVAARQTVPAGSLVLTVGDRTPAELADEVLASVTATRR